MKRSVFAILALCVITVGLVGCGGGGEEIPEGHTADEVRDAPANPVASPSADKGEVERGD